MERRRRLYFPRLYLDSDALIKGRIESLPELQSHPKLLAQTADAKMEMAAAKEILDKWNPDVCFVSMYGLMETLKCAVDDYGLSLERAVDVLSNACTDDFTILYAEFELAKSGGDLVKKFEAKLPDVHVYSSVRVQGTVVDEKGQDLGRHEWGAHTMSGGGSSDYWIGSPQTQVRVAGVKAVESHRVNAPKFERELFLRAIELSQAYKIKPKDSIHLAIALGEFEYIVTTDNGFYESVNKTNSKGYPKAAKPSELVTRFQGML